MAEVKKYRAHISAISEQCVEALRKDPVDFKDEDEELESALLDGLKAINWHAIIPKGAKVLLKVNGCHYRFMPGLVTVPAVAAKFIEILLERADTVVVCESDLQRWDADIVLKGVGYKRAIERVGGTVINLSKTDMMDFQINGELFTKRPLPKIFQQCDVFITMPVLKTHKLWYISLGLKNQFGCIPESDRIKYMKWLPALVADINSLLKPKINIIDGVFGLEGDGPIAGIPKRMGVFVTANNIVAGDLVGANIMKLSPYKSELIAHAIERNLGPPSIENINLTGLDIKDVARKFIPPSNDIVSRMERWVRKHPKLANMVYRSAMFKIAKRMAWFVRGISGYKNQYEEAVIKSGVWEGYDYKHLIETNPTEG